MGVSLFTLLGSTVGFGVSRFWDQHTSTNPKAKSRSRPSAENGMSKCRHFSRVLFDDGIMQSLTFIDHYHPSSMNESRPNFKDHILPERNQLSLVSKFGSPKSDPDISRPESRLLKYLPRAHCWTGSAIGLQLHHQSLT